MLDWLARHGRLDWSRAVVDSRHVRAGDAGEDTGPSRVDRRTPGSQRPLVIDAQGTPLAAVLTAANRNDAPECLPLPGALPPRVGPRGGRPRRRPGCVRGDAAYGTQANRAGARARGIEPLLAWQGEPHGSGLGRLRSVVERTMASLTQFRRLRVRDERKAEHDRALLHLACAVLCWRVL